MTSVLFVGQQPETVDFTDPTLPPGVTAEKIHAGIALALKQMAERGWRADLCLIQPDETAGGRRRVAAPAAGPRLGQRRVAALSLRARGRCRHCSG